MNLLHKGIIGTLCTLGAANVTEKAMARFETKLFEPIDNVSIIMATYNEEFTAELAIASVRSQSIIRAYPQYFDIILVDSGSKDKTVELVKPYLDQLIITPRGKLTARNIAINQAKGSIIVSVDADAYYPYNWLNTLLAPFNNLSQKSIAGVVGSTLDYSIPRVPGQLHTVAYNIFERMIIRPNQMVGRNSAFYKHLFYLSGMFNEKINQFDIQSVVKEEEHDFGLRLAKLGKIIFKLNATCIHLGGKKIACRAGFVNDCDNLRIGKERF